MDVPQGVRFLILTILALSFSSCEAGKARYFPDELLVPILRDLHYARASTYNMTSPASDSAYRDLKLQVCLLHGVSPESLDHDLQLLLTRPEEMEQLFQQVIDSLETSTVQEPSAY